MPRKVKEITMEGKQWKLYSEIKNMPSSSGRSTLIAKLFIEDQGAVEIVQRENKEDANNKRFGDAIDASVYAPRVVKKLEFETLYQKLCARVFKTPKY